MSEPKYKIGDKIKIVNYGHWIYTTKKERQEMLKVKLVSTAIPKNILRETEDGYFVDMRPDRVGVEDVIDNVTDTQGIPQ